MSAKIAQKQRIASNCPFVSLLHWVSLSGCLLFHLGPAFFVVLSDMILVSLSPGFVDPPHARLTLPAATSFMIAVQREVRQGLCLSFRRTVRRFANSIRHINHPVPASFIPDRRRPESQRTSSILEQPSSEALSLRTIILEAKASLMTSLCDITRIERCGSPAANSSKSIPRKRSIPS